MADKELKRSTPLAQPKPRRLDTRRKNCLHETVYDLNRGFAVVLETFEGLERQAFFRRDYLRAFRNMADELRARTNHELTATLRDREQREAAQFGRLCRKWEETVSIYRKSKAETPTRPTPQTTISRKDLSLNTQPSSAEGSQGQSLAAFLV